jgi:hypothetical protein
MNMKTKGREIREVRNGEALLRQSAGRLLQGRDRRSWRVQRSRRSP